MARLIGIVVGLGFVLVALWSFVWGFAAYVSTPHEETLEHKYHKHARDIAFSFEGPFGTYDRQQLQRGFQVYREVCAACHGLGYIAFRNLEGLGYNEAEIDAIAEQWPIQAPAIDPNTGEATTRAPIAADMFPDPYPNDIAARAANNNAVPPDLSLVVEARHGGAEYIQSLLSGYRQPPAELPPAGPGLYYNPYFANLFLAMPPPITADGQVTYADGTPATVDQMSHDVSAFLAWTAEPNLEARHQAGVATLIFLLFATLLAYLSYRNIWAGKKPKKRKKVVGD